MFTRSFKYKGNTYWLLALYWVFSTSATYGSVATSFSEAIGENSKYIIGHYRNNTLHSSVYEIGDIPAAQLTHLIYQSAKVTENGTVELAERFIDVQKLYLDLDIEKTAYAGNFAKLAQLKNKYPQLKILISIGQWHESKIYRDITKTPEQRRQLAMSCIDFMETYGFDGIDIYWQAYEDKRPELPAFLQDRAQFILFMDELHTQLKQRNKNALLSVLLKNPAIEFDWPVEELADKVDFVNLAANYFHGHGELTTNHISALYSSTDPLSVDAVVSNFSRHNFPLQKIVLDIGTYGQGWQGIKNINHGYQQEAASISLGSWDITSSNTGLYSHQHVQQIIAMKGYTEYWDDSAKAAYAFNPDRYSGHFISYENERSIGAKIDYAMEKGLGGMGIMDLHNDNLSRDALLNSIHKRFYLFQNIKIAMMDFFSKNKESIFAFMRSVAVIVFFLIAAAVIYMGKKRKHNIEINNLGAQKDNVLLLEWSLIQLLYLISYSRKTKIQFLSSPLNTIATSLLQATTNIVSRSGVRYATKNINLNVLDILAVLINAKIIINETKKDTDILLDGCEKIRIQSDYMLLTQIIYLLCSVLGSSQRVSRITINSSKHSDGAFTLNFSVSLLYEAPQKIDYFLLKDAYVLASLLGLTLLYTDDRNSYLSLYFPCSAVVNDDANLMLPVQLSTLQNDNANNISPALDHQFASHFSRFASLAGQELKNVDFRKDSGRLIEQACESFLEMNNVLHVDVVQSEQQIAAIGIEPPCTSVTSEVISEDLTFTVHSLHPLNREEVMLFDALISQVQLVRKALKGLAKDSKLLSELHFLSSMHEDILYIQADGGYSFVYLDGVKEPKLLSIRFRAIKYFFDDDMYLQVHRSCIVNPNKVKQVRQPHKMKFEIIIANKKLPLSRTYVTELKARYPHWFVGI